MSKAAQRKEKQHWTVEKPKLDNARKWRGIYFIVTEEKEFKETHEKRAGFESSARFRKKRFIFSIAFSRNDRFTGSQFITASFGEEEEEMGGPLMIRSRWV